MKKEAFTILQPFLNIKLSFEDRMVQFKKVNLLNSESTIF